MKKLISFFAVAILSVSTLFASDATLVANWQFPIFSWFNPSVPTVGIEAYPRSQAYADSVAPGFDTVGCDFNAIWTGISTPANVISHVLGNSASNKGGADFTNAEFKTLYDDNNIYILLQYTDDDVTGNETVEVMMAPDFKIDAIDALTTNIPAPYIRYAQFGALKATFTNTKFDAAMLVNYDTYGVGRFDWSLTTPTLSTNLFIDNHTTTGSKTVKQIITIGYQALTGEARTEFSNSILRSINSGKGISFDLKINDNDADDALNADEAPIIQPAAYWWNSTSNDGYVLTYYSGFLGVKRVGTGFKSINAQNSIFGKVINNQIQLNQIANVTVYNSLGKNVLNAKNVNVVNLSNLVKGLYIIRVNNESLKLVR